jgi:hypothetical protein
VVFLIGAFVVPETLGGLDAPAEQKAA